MLKGDHTQSRLTSEAKQGWAGLGGPLEIAGVISFKKERKKKKKKGRKRKKEKERKENKKE